MAIFGRRSARKRMRRATEQALSVPAFRTPVDCTPWVLGGLWPTELNEPRPETASLAAYLRNDLHRIADSANQKLREINEAGLAEPARQAEEARVINVARAFAVLRVESTIRHLRQEPLGFQPEYLSLGTVPDEPTRVVRREHSEPTVVIEHHDAERPTAAAPPEMAADVPPPPSEAPEIDWATVKSDPLAEPQPAPVRMPEPTPEPEPTPDPPAPVRMPTPQPDPPTPPAPRRDKAVAATQVESSDSRLRRLLTFVARQEPGLAWAVGDRSDGSTVLATDLAHGWIPPGVSLPAGVELLLPQRRRGNLNDIIGHTEHRLTYRPGDGFASPTDLDVTSPDLDVRRLEAVPDLGWRLAEATHWRDGLPRMVHTMAKAGAAGTGVVDAELDVLRVHLDTARYQVFSQYPDVGDRLFCNCLLLAATEAIASGDQVAANYHFAWYIELTAVKVEGWGQQP
ncbi:hypothetical protein MCHIJ_15820 [Mycolicibacterium chitae]|nr:DUF5631 domain-containing protein [Mycolicibacterium chitae]MCV7107281.1 DUF5631 domain-containing protein [Mycolicibacterium chitae]BBZ02145.1 hypothetical protein MCHIJ_15820 [Mycolicibacterium chitae]